ncbi:MAG: hypothetical protein IJ724_01285 [Muribaculaceae bacterium]|nr:hypothetical protein [Muribaculaceae bacterium]
MREALRNVLRVLVAIVLGMVVCWLIGGCKTRYIEVAVPVHDSTKVVSVQTMQDTLWRYDTERIVDTMYIDTSTIATLGMPTLRHDRLAERTSDKGKVRVVSSTDTIYVEREVPVPVKETVVQEVNRLRWWQEVLCWAGGIALLVCGAWVVLKAKL